MSSISSTHPSSSPLSSSASCIRVLAIDRAFLVPDGPTVMELSDLTRCVVRVHDPLNPPAPHPPTPSAPVWSSRRTVCCADKEDDDCVLVAALPAAATPVTAARTLGGLQAIEDNWRRACAAALDVMPPDPALGAVARRGVGLLAVRQDDTSFWFLVSNHFFKQVCPRGNPPTRGNRPGEHNETTRRTRTHQPDTPSRSPPIETKRIQSG